jgi:UDP-N-acetylmuramate--alanine ligase
MRVYFIGVGGIGVSSLAQYYLAQGADVFGSDLASSEITDLLKEKGAKLLFGKQKSENLPKDVDLVIYSPAVEKTNPELKYFRETRVKCKSYPEALGELTKKYFTIAISGAHGKSTTTAMVALVLAKAGLDPTVIVGTKLKEFGNSNFRPGGPAKSPYGDRGVNKYLVIEADEWNASFLNYWPRIIVLTNIEREHLDYYKDLSHILKTFKEYVGHLPKDGVLVANGDDANISKLKFKTQNYFLKQKESAILRKILKVPGEHNVSNALAALTVARVLKIPDKISFEALSKYKGAWRRFEERESKIKNLKLKIIDDYGHHPTEINATLKAAREKFPNKKIWCVFQPHQYQRTFYLFKDFVKVFKNAPVDKIIITDIYSVAGREAATIKKKVNSQKLVEAIKKPNVIYLATNRIKDYLKKNLKGGEIVIIMGAGSIYELSSSL